jgi:hypothetical protein
MRSHGEETDCVRVSHVLPDSYGSNYATGRLPARPRIGQSITVGVSFTAGSASTADHVMTVGITTLHHPRLVGLASPAQPLV